MNLVEVAKSSLSGPVVERIGSLVGVDAGHAQHVVEDALPPLFESMASQAQSAQGAERLYQQAKASGQEEGALLERPDTLDGVKAESLLQKGRGLLYQFFGARESAVVDGVAAHAGVSPGAASKILALVSPLALAALGKEVLSRGLGASGLAQLLSGQRAAFAGAPAAAVTSGAEVYRPPPRSPARRANPVGWMPLLLLALVAFGGFFLLSRGRAHRNLATRALSGRSVGTPAPEVAPVPEVTLRTERLDPAGERLASFFEDPRASLPKRFVVEGLIFDPGLSSLAGAPPASLDAIAAALNAHPNAAARVEGYTDEAGNAAADQALALERAQKIRDLLIQRGVSPDRVAIAGHGAEPAAPAGADRAQSRRIELVIVRR